MREDTSQDSRVIRLPATEVAELLAQLRDENAFLRREIERKDAFLLSLSEGLKPLSSPAEPSESPLTATADDGREGREGEEGPPRRPW